MEKLHQLFQLIWQHEPVPQDFKDATIVHLYKRKGNRQACDNHRGISLLSIAGKVLVRVLLNGLIAHLEKGLLPENQCGFRKEHGTIDMVFVARQLQDKCQEQNIDLYSTYVDLTKAFDTVSREGLWKIMYGCPRKFIAIVRQLHDGMLARVQENGEISKPFPVSNGLKQDCVLAPILFSLVFSAMLTDAFSISNALALDIEQMDQSSASGGFKQKPRFHQTPSTTSCLPTTVPSTLPRKPPCSTAWTSSLTHATISA